MFMHPKILPCMISISCPYPVIVPKEYLDYVVHFRTSYSVDLALKRRTLSRLFCLRLIFGFLKNCRQIPR